MLVLTRACAACGALALASARASGATASASAEGKHPADSVVVTRAVAPGRAGSGRGTMRKNLLCRRVAVFACTVLLLYVSKIPRIR